MLQNQLSGILCNASRQARSVALINRLLPAACRVSFAVTAATTLWLLGASSGYALQQYTETFDTGLGRWTTDTTYTNQSFNHSDGFNIGWSSGTANAGGAAGEVGGTWARVNKKATGVATAPIMPHILDTVSFAGGNMVSLNMPLSASGKMILNDSGTADCTVYVGFFKNGPLTGFPNGYDAGAERLILRITAPSSSGSGLWRFNFGSSNTQQSPTRTTVPDNTWSGIPLNFNFNWTPTGLNDGSGTVSGSVQKAGGGAVVTITPWTIGAAPYGLLNFDSFGIWADSSSGTDPTRIHTEWFDDMQYTVVPEPSAALLLPLGAGLLLLTRRTLRRKQGNR